MRTKLFEPGVLDEARALAGRYWDSFTRDPLAGRASAGPNTFVIVDTEALSLTLPRLLSELLGDAGAELSIYGFGKCYGVAAAQHFASWARREGATEDIIAFGPLFWPMHAGLAPRMTLLEVQTEPHPLLLIEIARGSLDRIRAGAGLDARPARTFVSGLVSGALSTSFAEPIDARLLSEGVADYRIVAAPPTVLASDLEEPRLRGPLSDFTAVVEIEA